MGKKRQASANKTKGTTGSYQPPPSDPLPSLATVPRPGPSSASSTQQQRPAQQQQQKPEQPQQQQELKQPQQQQPSKPQQQQQKPQQQPQQQQNLSKPAWQKPQQQPSKPQQQQPSKPQQPQQQQNLSKPAWQKPQQQSSTTVQKPIRSDVATRATQQSIEAAESPSSADQRLEMPSTSQSSDAIEKQLESCSISNVANVGSSTGGDTIDSHDDENVEFPMKKRSKEKGRIVKLKCNLFEICPSKETPPYYHYNIEIVGEESKQTTVSVQKKNTTPKSKRTRKELNDVVFKEVIDKMRKDKLYQGSLLPVFDGNKNFYTLNKIDIPTDWSVVVSVKDREKMVNIKVNITTPEFSHYQTLSNLSRTTLIMPPEMQALDIVLRNGARQSKIALGSNFFPKTSYDETDPRDRFDVGQQDFRTKQVYRDNYLYGKFGIYQCGKLAEHGLYMNVDRSIALFSQGGRLTDLINRVTRREGLNDFHRKNIEKRIKNMKFDALHLNHRTFTITGFSKRTISETFFKKDSGEQVSVYDYFCQEYASFCKTYRLDPKQLCIQVGQGRNAKYFPIECVHLKNDEVFRGQLDATTQGNVTKNSTQPPHLRFDAIQRNVKSIKADSTTGQIDYPKAFGIESISENPVEVDGRVLNAPKIQYKNKQVDTRNAGQWQMRGEQFFEPCPSIGGDWACINFQTICNRPNRFSISSEKFKDLIKRMVEKSKALGIDLKHMPETSSWQKFNYNGKNTLKRDLFDRLNPKCKLVVCIIPDNSEIYNEIKAVAELKNLGAQGNLITQCLLQSQNYWKDGKENLFDQMISNLFLKINSKMGGTNNTLDKKDRPPLLKDKKTMFVGLDVTHPSPTDGLTKSIAACVATYTDHFDKSFKVLKVQEKARKEVVDLRVILRSFLDSYSKINKSHPEKIVVYRDGIGEGDFVKIKNTELKDVQNACADLKQNKIKITYIMCQKRHNIRFMKQDGRNVDPGTVVDTKIVSHKFWETYLNSHASPLGTARSAKYVIIHDDNNLEADDFQQSTYNLCYLYPRCLKSSSIVPFVQYAHLLAKRGRCYLKFIEKDDSSSMSSRESGGFRQVSQNEINQLNQMLIFKDCLTKILFFV